MRHFKSLCISAILSSIFYLFVYLFNHPEYKDYKVDQCTAANTSFEHGEYLVYRAYYNLGPIWIPAGEASFELTEEEDFYHIKVIGKTYTSYDSFYKVHDEYDSYIDKKSLRPILFIRNVQEGSYTRYDSILFDTFRDEMRSFYGKTRASAKEYVFTTDDCMHDLLSVLYFVRNLNYDEIPKKSMIPLDIFFDKNKYSIKMEYRGKVSQKKIRGLGKNDVIKIIPEAIDGHIFNDNTKMTIWASDDLQRIPLLVESRVKIGMVKGVLLSDKSKF